jgi:hypothetical protein
MRAGMGLHYEFCIKKQKTQVTDLDELVMH